MVFIILLLSGGAASTVYFKQNLDAYHEIDNNLCANNHYDNNNAIHKNCNSLIRIFASEIAAGVSFGYIILFIHC